MRVATYKSKAGGIMEQGRGEGGGERDGDISITIPQTVWSSIRYVALG